ncbi:DUF2812 domain-containing protein [Sporosarcina sp. FA9]|uniref:DUF2812 domain-containing protein n=1 Tax=Sporosarcina sp. FA9 TaxID=3413030 RepID=UPI003F65EC58
MNKIVRKMLFGDFWRIGEHESWFSDMASEGLHLKKTGYLFAHFEKGEPEDIRYRIEMSLDKNIQEELKELYMESGWDHVTKFKEFNVFTSPASFDSPELHTDPAEQSYSLQAFDKKIARNTMYVGILSVLGIGLLSFMWFIDNTPTLTFLDGGSFSYLFTVLAYLYLVFTMIRATRSIRKLRNNLTEGIPINHKAPWKRHYRINLVQSYIIISIAAIGAVIPFMQIAMHKSEALPKETADTSIVRLMDIEQNPELVLKQAVVKDLFSDKVFGWESQITYDWSPLAPRQYETRESGVVPKRIWDDKSGTYSPSVNTQVYFLAFPILQDRILADLMWRNNFIFDGIDPERLESQVFDMLFTRELEESKEVTASKGKGIIHVRYYGYADIEDIIKVMEEKMDLIQIN